MAASLDALQDGEVQGALVSYNRVNVLHRSEGLKRVNALGILQQVYIGVKGYW